MDLERLKGELRRDEGFVAHPYKDHLGNLTVGCGHLITANDPPPDDPCWRDPLFLEDVFEIDVNQALIDADTFVTLGGLPERVTA